MTVVRRYPCPLCKKLMTEEKYAALVMDVDHPEGSTLREQARDHLDYFITLIAEERTDTNGESGWDGAVNEILEMVSEITEGAAA